jgi:cytochrome c
MAEAGQAADAQPVRGIYAVPYQDVLNRRIERNDVSVFIAFRLTSGVASVEGDSGQQAFNNACRTCHMVREGNNRLGPNLYKIVGRKAGSLPDYAFSNAMKEADFVWDEEKLDHFIAKPDEIVPGNNMKPYGGLASSDDRKKIIGFLARQQ